MDESKHRLSDLGMKRKDCIETKGAGGNPQKARIA
jgi:hypothetical protein